MSSKMISFGAWMRRCQALHLTRVALAARVGCAEVTLAKIERDERRPSCQIAERLALYLCPNTKERGPFVHAARGELATIRLNDPDLLPAEPAMIKQINPDLPDHPFVATAKHQPPTCAIRPVWGAFDTAA